jgi:TolA-binding protein
MNNLGVLLLDVKGEKEEARELFRQVIVRAPGTGVAKMAAANLQRLENMAPAPQK